jgi:hypothetical protein
MDRRRHKVKRIPVLVIAAAVAVGLACTPSPSPKVTSPSRGDVLLGAVVIPSVEGPAGFDNRGLWEGSGSVLEMYSQFPTPSLKVMLDVNPFQIDPVAYQEVPLGNFVGGGLLDDHPTVAEATLDLSGCPA